MTIAMRNPVVERTRMFVQSLTDRPDTHRYMSVRDAQQVADARTLQRHLLPAIRAWTLVLTSCGLWTGIYLAATAFG